jgi:hypothetical protein
MIPIGNSEKTWVGICFLVQKAGEVETLSLRELPFDLSVQNININEICNVTDDG